MTPEARDQIDLVVQTLAGLKDIMINLENSKADTLPLSALIVFEQVLEHSITSLTQLTEKEGELNYVRKC